MIWNVSAEGRRSREEPGSGIAIGHSKTGPTRTVGAKVPTSLLPLVLTVIIVYPTAILRVTDVQAASLHEGWGWALGGLLYWR